MSRIYQAVTSILPQKSAPPADPAPSVEETPPNNKEAIKPDESEDTNKADDVKENDAPELSSDKKTDELIEPQPQKNILWRLSSGVYSSTTGAVTGAVGYGVGGVKWVAGKSYDAGSAVVTTTKTVAGKIPKPTLKRKSKND